MIQLSNIQFQSNSKFSNEQARKYIRFSFKKTIIKSKNFCTYGDDSTLKWSEVIKLPQIYNSPIDFEIYDSYEFGYNPEALQTVVYGQIKIVEGEKVIKSNVYSNQLQNVKIGTLMFNIKKEQKQLLFKKVQQRTEHKVEQKIAPQTRQVNEQSETPELKVITSILIRNLQNPPLKGYITVTTQNPKKTLKSQMIEPLKGQFMYFMKSKTNDYLIKSKDTEDQITVQFHSQNGKFQGKGHYRFNPFKRINRIDLLDLENARIGELYIEAEKKQPKPEKSNIGLITSKKQSQEQTGKKSSLSLYKLRSLSQSQLTRMGESQFLGTSRQKRMSVFHHNNDIIFSSQRRFQIYEDKQTNIISYSDLPSMKFQEQHSKKFYKGASIGKGQKQDFTRYYKQNPGWGSINCHPFSIDTELIVFFASLSFIFKILSNIKMNINSLTLDYQVIINQIDIGNNQICKFAILIPAYACVYFLLKYSFSL